MKKHGKSIVAVLVLLGLAALLTVHVIVAKAETTDTYHSSWVRIKDSAAEDAANFATTLALATNEGNFANKTSGAYQIVSRAIEPQPFTSSAGGAWIFAFYGTDAADETFSFTMVGWAKGNGMAEVICEGNGILGTQDVVLEPNGDAITNGFWADTIELDETTKWPSVAVFNSDDNQVAKIFVDMAGLEWVDFITYDVAGGAEASTIGVYGRQY